MAGLAAVLLLAVAVDRFPGVFGLHADEIAPAADSGMFSEDSLSTLTVKKQELENYKSNADAINQAYFQHAARYSDRIANLAGLVTGSGEDDKVFLERVMREKIESFNGIDNLKLSFSESEPLAKKVRKILVDISFTAASSDDAAKLFAAMGQPQYGFAWRNVELSADRLKKQVSVTGRVAALLAEAAE